MTFEQTIAGHRVLRLLATGARSRVWLAAGDRVLKVLPDGDVAAEVLALHRARGEHVVDLIDVAVDDEGAVLVFPRLPRGSLADVLGRDVGLDAGEAVTALAPIASALARLHAAGVAHGSISAAHVLFRDDGAPMLIGLGGARTFEAGLPEVVRGGLDAVVADRAALAQLAAVVLSRVTGPRAPAAAALAAGLRERPQDEPELRLGRELFDIAAARPVRLEPGPVEDSGPRRAVGVASAVEPPEPQPGLPARRRLLAAAAMSLESGIGNTVRSALRERWQRLGSSRRRAVAGGAAGLLALVVAVSVIPSGSPPSTGDTASPPVPAASGDSGGHPTDPVDDPAVTGDDPLAALGQLLPRRTECFRELSVLCFDEVDAPGSAALDDDRAALDALIAQAQQPDVLDAAGATVVERLGDGALIALAPDSEPASVLLLRGEAGWRIRDYVAGG